MANKRQRRGTLPSILAAAQLYILVLCSAAPVSRGQTVVAGAALRGTHRHLLQARVPPSATQRKPPPSSSPAPTANACDDEAQTRALVNSLREKHRAGPLRWDQDLASASGQWARVLATGGCEMLHSGGTREYGESAFGLASSLTLNNTCSSSLQAWYSQSRLYDFKSTKPYTANAEKPVSHFVQLVWRDTTAFGCGVAQAPYTSPHVSSPPQAKLTCKVVVCRFKKPGGSPNDKAYAANVLAALSPR